MSPQEEILQQVKTSIVNSAELNTLIGAPPKVFYLAAEENTKCPYFVMDIPKPRNIDTAVWEGELRVKVWFYTTNASKALSAEDIIQNLFNNKIIKGPNVKACRLWTKTESRNQGIKKDHIMNYDAVFIDVVFYMRWIVKSRIASAEF